MNEEKDRAILVGLQLNDGSSFEHNLEELESLCQACDIAPVFTITQSLDAPHQALYIGSGKVHEVKEAAAIWMQTLSSLTMPYPHRRHAT